MIAIMSEDTRSALFGLFVLADCALTASQVIALAAPIGITATNVKSHLTRMVSDGSLKRTGKARLATYAPSRNRESLVAKLKERLGDPNPAPWRGDWLLLVWEGAEEKQAREAAYAALWFDGFRPLAPATFIRPAWPDDWALERARLHSAPAGLTFDARPGGWDPSALSALYDLDAIDAQARAIAADLMLLKNERTPSAAFASRLRAGGDVARFIAHDPHLPETLWGGRTGLQTLRKAWRRFEAATAPLSDAFIAEVIGRRSAIAARSRRS